MDARISCTALTYSSTCLRPATLDSSQKRAAFFARTGCCTSGRWRRSACRRPVRDGDPHYHQYTLDDLGALCGEAGLQVEYLTTVNVLPGLKHQLRRTAGAGVSGIPRESPPEPLNTILRMLIATEGRILAATGWRCPVRGFCRVSRTKTPEACARPHVRGVC